MDRLNSKLDIAKEGIGKMASKTEEIIQYAAKRDEEMMRKRSVSEKGIQDSQQFQN